MIFKLLTARARNALNESLLFALPKVKVKVNQGIVKGVIEPLPDGSGRNFQRFSGIPYAQPPIGELRFRAPQKLMKFENEEIDCTRERDQTFHYSGFTKEFIGSENSLNLNVYAPAEIDGTKKRAVMVFIHGGGFKFDSNRRDL
jgi:carboxylesterase type B